MQHAVHTSKQLAYNILDQEYSLRLSSEGFPLAQNYKTIDNIRQKVAIAADGQNDIHLLSCFCDGGTFIEEALELVIPSNHTSYPLLILKNWLIHISGSPAQKYGLGVNTIYHLRHLGVERSLLFKPETEQVDVIPHRILFSFVPGIDGMTISADFQQYLAFILLISMMSEKEITDAISDRLSSGDILESIWEWGKKEIF